MKSLLLLAGALACSTSVALAQTVLPSGAVVTSRTAVTPGTVPGSQPLTPPGMRDGGNPRASRHKEKVPGMSHQDRKRLRKMAKIEPSSDEKPKAPAN